jgi:hypothetical protein
MALNDLEQAQRDLALAQKHKLEAKWWTDLGEVLKFAGAVAGLLIVLVGGILQIWTGALTAQIESLKSQILTNQRHLSAMSAVVPQLKGIQADLIASLNGDTLKFDQNWKNETISDAYLTIAGFDVGCGDYAAARQDIETAKLTDTNGTPFGLFLNKIDDIQASATGPKSCDGL